MNDLILGIETSCDETAIGIVEARTNKLLANSVASQIALHAPYFGVVPELASRAHLEKIQGVIAHALKSARLDFSRISAIGYTQGPGLKGALLVGEAVAKALSAILGKPAIGVHHLEAHLACALFDFPDLAPPFLGLIVSGGHTDLVIVRQWGRYRVLGRTLDDACGEAFDKFAKMFGLGYPGGPLVDKLARGADAGAVAFPRPLLPGSYNFSFSGLKTSVLYWLKDHGKPRGRRLNDVCASFQQAICETLVFKTTQAARDFKVKRLVVSGGVAANSNLRALLAGAAAREGWKLYIPKPNLCTDNGAMIALTASLMLKQVKKPAAGLVDTTLPFTRWSK